MAKLSKAKKTSSSTEVKSPTSTKTSTDAYTAGNVTVTGGAGRGANTTVHTHPGSKKADKKVHGNKGMNMNKGMSYVS